MNPAYSKLHPAELAELEQKYGRELKDHEALWLMRQERESQMRENEFYSRTAPQFAGRCSPIDSDECEATDEVSRVVSGRLSGAGAAQSGQAGQRTPDAGATRHAGISGDVRPVTCEEIIDADDDRWPVWVPLGILAVIITFDAWVIAHWHVVAAIRSWFR